LDNLPNMSFVNTGNPWALPNWSWAAATFGYWQVLSIAGYNRHHTLVWPLQRQPKLSCMCLHIVCVDEFWLSLRWSHGTVESTAFCHGLYSTQLLPVCVRHEKSINILVTTRKVIMLFMYMQVLGTDMKVVLRKCSFIELNCCGVFCVLLFSVHVVGKIWVKVRKYEGQLLKFERRLW
jgi:hypothetical protein